MNVRVGKPSVNAPIYQNLAPGSEVEVDGNLYKGETFEGIDTWMKDETGNYYWSGGLNGEKQPGNYPWWIENSLFSIPKIWTIPNEQVVRVAILDTGISEHVDFDFAKITGYNYLTDSVDFKNDINGHGTHCAGIIAANGTRSYGIAPETHLFIAKVCDDYGRPVIAAIKKALDEIYSGEIGGNEISVINMSFSLVSQSALEDGILKEIENVIMKLYREKNCILICSGGEAEDFDDSFPAKLKECIAVGSINSNLMRSSFSRITPILDIMAPGEAISSSAKTDSTVNLTGTSQAAAFVSGVASLAIQKMKTTAFSSDLFSNKLYETAYSNSFLNTEYGHGIINPNRFVESLKIL